MYLRHNPVDFWPRFEGWNFVFPSARLERKNGVQMRSASVPNAIKTRPYFIAGLLLSPLEIYLTFYHILVYFAEDEKVGTFVKDRLVHKHFIL